MTDQKPPEPLAILGTHEQFVELFDDFLGAVYPPSGGMRTDTGRQKLASSLVGELTKRSAVRILDCAAGTGFPSLDIEREAPHRFEIHCCDGDDKMIAILETEARKHEIDLRGMMPQRTTIGREGGRLNQLVVNWADLDKLENRYDYVLCRGNALAYADTWAGNEQVVSDKTLRDYLTGMIRRVRPGGHLHVDAPKTTELDQTISRTIGTDEQSIKEEVKVKSGRRRWTVTFRNGKEDPVRFIRYSSILTCDRLRVILKDLGLRETELVDLPGERPNFGVIIARRPA